MGSRILAHLRANVVAYLALFVALGSGTAMAATHLARNSVGTAQLKKNAVVSAKVRDGSLLAADFAAGQLPAGQPGPQGERGPRGERGEPGPAADLTAAPAIRASVRGPSAVPTTTNTPVELIVDSDTYPMNFETAPMHEEATYSPKLTAPRDGIYLVIANVSWQPNTTGERDLFLSLDGKKTVASDGRTPVSYADGETPQSVSTTLNMQAGEYVEAFGYQSSGSSLFLSAGAGSFVTMYWLGPSS